MVKKLFKNIIKNNTENYTPAHISLTKEYIKALNNYMDVICIDRERRRESSQLMELLLWHRLPKNNQQTKKENLLFRSAWPWPSIRS